MWEAAQIGNCVLVECPSRWYLGIVSRRTGVTIALRDAVAGHDLGDFGMFLEGEISESTELTPLPRGIEINLGSVDSIQSYPAEFLPTLRKRTHVKQSQKR